MYHFNSIKVLLVEDTPPMLEIVKALLLTFGIGDVITARDGETGYELFCQHRPDIVLADWMMKRGNGIELCHRIRNEKTSPNKYVPYILLTGFSEKKRVIMARDVGITEFMVKPFTAQDLYKRIAQIIERPRQFVRSEDFFGPDRRRLSNPHYLGPFKRDSDREMMKTQKTRMQQAGHDLAALREKAGIGKTGKFNIKSDDIDIDFS